MINQCPFKVIGKDHAAVRDVIDTAHFIERGAGWPAPGGWGDQTAACIDGVRCVWDANREIDKRLKDGKGEY